MSLSSAPMRAVCVRDPRTLISDSPKYAVLKGGSQVTAKQYSTTSISNSSLQFSCPPPSGAIFVDRAVKLRIPIRLSLVGIPAIGDTLLRPNFDAPRAYPLSSSIETISVTINNQAVSINLADVIQPMMWFDNSDELKNADFSLTPDYQDQSASYNDLVGTIRNPLANYGSGLDNTPQPRGAFPFVVGANPVGNGVDPVTAVVDMDLCEALMLAPLWWGKGVSSEAFFNVTTMDFNITLLQGFANRLWSHATASGGVVISSASAVIGGQLNGPTSFSNNSPFLFFTYITPQETQQDLVPNRAIAYPYYDVQRYTTAFGSSVAAGATITAISNNLQLNSIPRRIFIFMRKSNQALYNINPITPAETGPMATDTFFSISNLSMQYQNKNGLLASASAQQLYLMAVKNGCTMSWTQWSGKSAGAGATFPAGGVGTVGSVICCEFGTDIGLDSLEAPGKLSQGQLQVTVTATNISGVTIDNPELYIITVLEGIFTIEGLGRSSTNIGVITSADILDCQKSAAIDYRDIKGVGGGDFLSSMKEGLSRLFTKENLSRAKDFAREHKLVSRGLTAAIPYAGPLEGLVAPAAAYAAYQGYGGKRGVSFGKGDGGVLAGRMRRRAGVLAGGADGGEAAGGEALSRAELARRILY